MLNSQIILASAEAEPALSPYAVGGIALGILILALLALVSFGGGREHS